MELAMAIMMVLGIFVGIPAVIGFTIGGAFILADRRARRAEQAQSETEAVTATEDMLASAQREQPAEAVGHQKTAKTLEVAGPTKSK